MRDVRGMVQEARREEQSGRLGRAIELYRKALQRQENELDAPDPNLYNHLGDLYLRAGEPRKGVECYVRAADHLEEQGLPRAAIALCKKILRNAPARPEVYLRVGSLQARVGLHAEARESYVEFAQRMDRTGEPESALDALREFADRSEDEEVRLALADRYLVAGRTAEAIDQLTLVERNRSARGEDAEEVRRRIAEVEGGATDRSVAEPVPADVGPEGADSGPDEEIVDLARELRRLSAGTEGEERLRRSLPVIDRLLALEPGQLDLLYRKLNYALALGEEEAALGAYRQLGEALGSRLDGFRLRFVRPVPSVPSAASVTVEARAVAAARS